MYELLYNVFYILSKNLKKSIYLFFFLLLLSAAFESLGIVIFFQGFKIFFSENVNVIEQNILFNFLALIGININLENKYLIFPIIIIIYLVKNIYLTFFNWWKYKFLANVRKDLANRLFKNYIFKEHSYHVNKNSSELIRNITGDTITFVHTVNQVMIFITEVFIVACVAGILIYLQPALTLSFIFIISLFLLASYFPLSKRLVTWGKKKQYFDGKIIRYLNEISANFRTFQPCYWREI